MKRAALFLICLISVFAVAVSCGGGGGGGGGAVALKDNAGPHNGGDAGGWGKGNATGNGFGGNGGGLGSSGDSNIIITGSTPLEVGRYNYNGASYDNVEALYAALAANTLEDVFYVDFQVEGESTPRKARVTANGRSNDGNDILIEHQYKAIFPGENGNEEVLFYKRDGIELPGASGTENENGFEFEKGWEVDNRFCPPGTILSVASSGDVDLTGRAELKTAVYGYKQATNDNNVPIPDSYILGFRESALISGDTVTVTTDRKITKLQLPSTSINLDLSGATDFKIVNLTNDYPGNLTSIILPSNAETIKGTAFYGCTSLTEVTLPSTLTSIEYDAFRGCDHLQSITIPAGVTSLPDNTFNGCNALSSVTFAPGSQLTAINKNVFEGCNSLSSIALPASVQSIGLEAFSGCSSLDTVTFAAGSHLQTIGGNAFFDCQSLSTIELPSTVATIGDFAFAACSSLESFTIPDGVTELLGTFYNCGNLASITIPSSVNNLKDMTFMGVKNGCELIFDSTAGSMEVHTGDSSDAAFPRTSYKVKFTGTSIPTTDSGNSIFNSYLSEVTLANTVTAIPQNAFENCSGLTKVTIENTPTEPSVLSSIGGSAFYNCTNLQTINIPGTVNAIGSQAFFQAGGGNLTMTFDGNQDMLGIVDLRTNGPAYKVVLKNGIPKAGGSSIFATNNPELTEVVYAGGYTLIANAFTGCSNLNQVTFQSYPTIIQNSPTPPLPDNVTRIIFEQGDNSPLGIGGSNNSSSNSVDKLFSPTRDYSGLYVKFMNDTSKANITVRAGAFDFAAAVNIHYEFNSHPNTAMTYDAGNCFITGAPGARTTFNSVNFTWNAGAKEWRQ